MAKPDKKGTFVPNTTPPPTDNAVRAQKAPAAAFDKAKSEGVTSITGKALTGDALAKFKIAYDKHPLIRGTYNADGSMKDDIKALTE